ncbi:MAG: hypothetical protein IPM91_05815 [Bacteroidetes bacterium]|nr:hypothetical protein [Bacteroidota bacterium]
MNGHPAVANTVATTLSLHRSEQNGHPAVHNELNFPTGTSTESEGVQHYKLNIRTGTL